MTRTLTAGLILFTLTLLTGACSQTPQPAPEKTSPAEQPAAMAGANVELKATQGNQTAGMLMLMPMGEGVHFSGNVTGLPAGKHGFHIHENGDCSAPDASSAGGHFNPDNKPHGAPDAPEHHAGDLGNIEADASGNATVNIHVNGITLEPDKPNSVMGKAIIVHAGADDFTTQPTGNAGARLACGVIQ